jgi:hypothetical protein
VNREYASGELGLALASAGTEQNNVDLEIDTGSQLLLGPRDESPHEQNKNRRGNPQTNQHRTEENCKALGETHHKRSENEYEPHIDFVFFYTKKYKI